MKKTNIVVWLLMLVLVSCKSSTDLTELEIQLIKNELIQALDNHIDDVVALDYDKVMSFYAADHNFFMDGKQLGKYQDIAEVYKWAMDNWQEIYRYQMHDHNIEVFSKEAAMMTALFNHGRIEPSGDTTESTGVCSYGMRKINDKWQIVIQQMDHIYSIKDGKIQNNESN